MSALVGKIGVAFAGASGGALALAKATASAGSEAAKAAQRAGVGLTVWQEYAYAAQRSGMETETLNAACATCRARPSMPSAAAKKSQAAANGWYQSQNSKRRSKERRSPHA